MVEKGKRGARGFTLIELVMVITILAILAAIGVPLYIDLADDAKSSAMKGAVNSIRGALSVQIAKDASQGGLGDCPSTVDGTMFRDGVVPFNPVSDLNDVKSTAGLCSATNTDLDGSTGWLYNSSSCRVCPNTVGVDPVTGKDWVEF